MGLHWFLGPKVPEPAEQSDTCDCDMLQIVPLYVSDTPVRPDDYAVVGNFTPHGYHLLSTEPGS